MIRGRLVIRRRDPRHLVAQAREVLADRLLQAAEVLRWAIREDIAFAGHGVPSDPFHPPHLQSGDLWLSYQVEEDRRNLRVRVGSDLPRARYLEFGTSRMAPRPHARRAYYRVRSDMQAVMGTPL
jgi:hypothetical protein